MLYVKLFRDHVRRQVHVSVRIIEANPTASEITARLSFRLAGRIARDAVTPSADLRVLLNSARGPEDFNFPEDG